MSRLSRIAVPPEHRVVTEPGILGMIEDDDQGVAFLGGLPRTLTQKVEKYRLKADAEAHQSGIWDREKEGFVVNRHTN
ncbi:MAG: hypothetical protein KDK89_13840 [Alphaproteobacteria bacterium]|nr:hypothetical protein [Alphaproteobacteria bacterium]